jgi:L-cysteine desulfidase
MEITVPNKIPKNIFVLIIAKMSNPFEIFFVNICVTLRTTTTNIIKISIENIPVDDVIMKNQNDSPAVTARDLNLGELVCILNRIDKCH